MALATSVWPTARLPTLRLREVEPFATAEALWDALEALRHPSLLHMALTLVQMERAAEAHAGRLVLLDPHLSFSVRNPSQWCNIAAACVGIWGAARVTRPISNCLLPARFDFGGMFRMTGVALAKPAAEGDVVRLVLWANGLAIHKQASILKGGQTELALTRPLLLPSVPYNYDGTSSYDTMHIWLETWPPHSVAQSTGVDEPMTLADRIADRGPCAALFASDGAEPSSDTVMPVELSRSVTLTW